MAELEATSWALPDLAASIRSREQQIHRADEARLLQLYQSKRDKLFDADMRIKPCEEAAAASAGSGVGSGSSSGSGSVSAREGQEGGLAHDPDECTGCMVCDFVEVHLAKCKSSQSSLEQLQRRKKKAEEKAKEKAAALAKAEAEAEQRKLHRRPSKLSLLKERVLEEKEQAKRRQAQEGRAQQKVPGRRNQQAAKQQVQQVQQQVQQPSQQSQQSQQPQLHADSATAEDRDEDEDASELAPPKEDPLMVECLDCCQWVVATTTKGNLAVGYCCRNVLVSRIS